MTMRNTAGRIDAAAPAAATEGALALALDFGEAPAPPARPVRPVMRLARPASGPDKYKVLEHRRRQAQIKARRLLDGI